MGGRSANGETRPWMMEPNKRERDAIWPESVSAASVDGPKAAKALDKITEDCLGHDERDPVCPLCGLQRRQSWETLSWDATGTILPHGMLDHGPGDDDDVLSVHPS